MKVEVVAISGHAPEALIFHDPSRPARAMVIFSRLLPETALFDAELSRRWGAAVIATQEFSTWWRSRGGRPAAAFIAEVLST